MNLPEPNPEFEALLDYLKQNRGCDLTGYKRSTLMRRFQHRMQQIDVENYPRYLQYLQGHPEEYLTLLNDVLINVTSFFRDRDAWDYLASDIFPTILDHKSPDEPIRVWSAGCAAGQEIYSLLILLAETPGLEACLARIQCYATDADETALVQARQGTYSDREITGISESVLQKYFVQTERGYTIYPTLREKIVFGYHDVTKDAPISKIDLLICRNVLIYFKPEAQASILARFHFALREKGFLFLGKTETLVNRKQIFKLVHLKYQVYTKGQKLDLEDYLAINPKPRQENPVEPLTLQTYFWQTAFSTNPVAQFAIDFSGCLMSANKQAHLLFGLTLADWNQSFHELEPGKLIASHTIVYHRRPMCLQDIEWKTSQGTYYFDVSIAPVLDAKKQLIGNTVAFLDKTDHKLLAEKLESMGEELTRVSETAQVAEMELEAAHQEIQLLEQNIQHKIDAHRTNV